MNLINMLPETNGKFHLLLHEVSEFPLQPQQWEYIKADETRLYQIIDTSRRLRSRIKEIKIIPKGHTCAQQHAQQDSARTRTPPTSPQGIRLSQGRLEPRWRLRPKARGAPVGQGSALPSAPLPGPPPPRSHGTAAEGYGQLKNLTLQLSPVWCGACTVCSAGV